MWTLVMLLLVPAVVLSDTPESQHDVKWCFGEGKTLTCDTGNGIQLDAIKVAKDVNCPLGQECCTGNIECGDAAGVDLAPHLYQTIQGCQGQLSCTLGNFTERAYISCNGSSTNKEARVVRVLYSCSVIVATTTTFQPLTDMQEDRKNTTGGNNSDVSNLGLMVGVPIAAVCVILLLIIVLVVCLKRGNKRDPQCCRRRPKEAGGVPSELPQYDVPFYETTVLQRRGPSSNNQTHAQQTSELSGREDRTPPQDKSTGSVRGAAHGIDPDVVYAVVQKKDSPDELLMQENLTYGDFVHHSRDEEEDCDDGSGLQPAVPR